MYLCDLFQQLILREGLNTVCSPDATDSRIQQPPHVHKHHTMKGDIWDLLSQLHTHTRTHWVNLLVCH